MDDERRWILKVQTVLTFVVLAACLFVILSGHYLESDLKWAYGITGLLIGYWLK